MSDWNEPHEADAGWAAAYRKRPEGCICRIEMNEAWGRSGNLLRRDFDLKRTPLCSYHFPELTQTLELVGEVDDDQGAAMDR